MANIKSIELGKLSKHQLVFLNRPDPERRKNKRGQLALNFSNITVQQNGARPKFFHVLEIITRESFLSYTPHLSWAVLLFNKVEANFWRRPN